ncbi:DUF1275 domain-containing protein [Histoplasma capsulatum H143]|uniref:DUF1275 domain-containing protein n=1 Tax=Ajellomyces capsulatus (strain H143) TaxID=544712 RepID=C6HF46_AJECH|nr:DUF1275 domain-containing protein [Histoplasma capsulatum H143]
MAGDPHPEEDSSRAINGEELGGFQIWGKTTSLLTSPQPLGNTIFLGLGASDALDQTTYHWLKALVSILSFLAGGVAFSKTQHFGPQTRRTMLINFGSQTLLVIVAASLLQSGLIEDSGEVTDHHVFLKLIPLSLVAFQCAGQMAASRQLGFSEIPTTVLTSLYYDLVSEPGIFRPFIRNRKANQRLTAIVGVIGGSVIGGSLSKSTGRVSPSLWIVATCRVGYTGELEGSSVVVRTNFVGKKAIYWLILREPCEQQMSDQLTRILQKKSSIEQAASDDAISSNIEKQRRGRSSRQERGGSKVLNPHIADEYSSGSMSADQDEQHSGQLEPDRLNQIAEFPLLDSLFWLYWLLARPLHRVCLCSIAFCKPQQFHHKRRRKEQLRRIWWTRTANLDFKLVKLLANTEDA